MTFLAVTLVNRNAPSAS